MALAHMHKGKVIFAAIYDPTMDQMFTAYKGKGAFLNGKKFKMESKFPDKTNILFLLSRNWKDGQTSKAMLEELINFNLYRTNNCEAVSWCHLARGIYDGMVCFSKDGFPDFAGSLIVKEAGGKFFNIDDEDEIKSDDRIFYGGNREVSAVLKKILDKVVKK
jgi:myo-inositol-1(or 4)-monophosphatase